MTSRNPIIITSSPPPPPYSRYRSALLSPPPPYIRNPLAFLNRQDDMDLDSAPATIPTAPSNGRTPDSNRPRASIGSFAMLSRQDEMDLDTVVAHAPGPTSPNVAPAPEAQPAAVAGRPMVADEAEEDNSPSPASEEDSDLSSIEGPADSIADAEEASTDGSDSGASVHEFVKDDREPDSDPSSPSDEESAVFTQSQGRAREDRTAKDELVRTLTHPDGAYTPFKKGDASARVDASDRKLRSDGGCPAGIKGKKRRCSDAESDKSARTNWLTDEDLRWLSFADEDEDTDGSDRSLGKSASSSSSAVARKKVKPEPRKELVKVICEWTHDDRHEEPLQPWRHKDVGKARADGPNLFPARRLSNGDIQIRYFPGHWAPCWSVSLRRPALPPQCAGCCDEEAMV